MYNHPPSNREAGKNKDVMELKKGTKFTGKWFDGIVEIDHINEEDNDLEVYITPTGGQRRFEHWNLQHAIWGFENGDYTKFNCQEESTIKEATK